MKADTRKLRFQFCPFRLPNVFRFSCNYLGSGEGTRSYLCSGVQLLVRDRLRATHAFPLWPAVTMTSAVHYFNTKLLSYKELN